MGCGCGKPRVARANRSAPVVAQAPVVQASRQMSSDSRVVATVSPYATPQQNMAPAHLQRTLRKTV
jgi:hypothetical protein